MIKRVLGVFGFALVAFGCASAQSDGAGSSQGAVTASDAQPVTLANYASDHRITEIDAIVKSIDAADAAHSLVRGDVPVSGDLCDGKGGDYSRSRFSDGGKIKKLLFITGFEESEQDTTMYYDDALKLRFLSQHRSDELGLQQADIHHYFDAAGNELITIVKSAEGDKQDQVTHDLANAPYRLPGDQDYIDPVPALAKDNPQGAYDPAVSKPNCG